MFCKWSILVLSLCLHQVLSQTTNDPSMDDVCPHSLARDKYLKTFNDTYCFRFVVKHHSWNNARLDCQKDGGDLVQVTDDSIQTFLVKTLKELHLHRQYWIGATDHEKEGTWMWVTGESVSYGHWHRGDGPTHHGGFFFVPAASGEDCALIQMETGQWHDYPCSRPFAYICQYGNGYSSNAYSQVNSVVPTSDSRQDTTVAHLDKVTTDNPPHTVSLH